MKFSVRYLLLLTVTVFVALVAVWVGAGLYWAVRGLQRQRAFDFWGKSAWITIRDADKVELLWLKTNKGGKLVDLECFDVYQIKDISAAPDLVQLRHSLLEDASFNWKEISVTMRKGVSIRKNFFAVRFKHQDKVVTVAFLDASKGAILYAENGAEAILNPNTRWNWNQFAGSYFPEATP